MPFKEQCLYWHNYFRTLHQVTAKEHNNDDVIIIIIIIIIIIMIIISRLYQGYTKRKQRESLCDNSSYQTQ